MIGIVYRLIAILWVLSIFWLNTTVQAKQIQEPLKKEVIFMYDPCDKGLSDIDEDAGAFLEPHTYIQSFLHVMRTDNLTDRICLPNLYVEIINPPD